MKIIKTSSYFDLKKAMGLEDEKYNWHNDLDRANQKQEKEKNLISKETIVDIYAFPYDKKSEAIKTFNILRDSYSLRPEWTSKEDSGEIRIGIPQLTTRKFQLLCKTFSTRFPFSEGYAVI